MQTAIAAPAISHPLNIEPSLPGGLGYIVGPFSRRTIKTILKLGIWEDASAVADILPNTFMVGFYLDPIQDTAAVWFTMKDFSLVEWKAPNHMVSIFKEKLRVMVKRHPELFTFVD